MSYPPWRWRVTRYRRESAMSAAKSEVRRVVQLVRGHLVQSVVVLLVLMAGGATALFSGSNVDTGIYTGCGYGYSGYGYGSSGYGYGSGYGSVGYASGYGPDTCPGGGGGPPPPTSTTTTTSTSTTTTRSSTTPTTTTTTPTTTTTT